MSEPTPPSTPPITPAGGDDDVPHRVLDELKLVFGPLDDEPEATAPTGTAPTTAPTTVGPVAPAAPVAPAGPAGPESMAESAPGAAPAPRTTIVIGGDDSLPDPVYLDDSDLDLPGRPIDDDSNVAARPTIQIGDELDSTGAFDAVSVPSRSMDPRVRARRIAVKRARGRKRLVWAGIGVLVVLVAVAVLAVFSSSLFAVEQVDVQGATYTQFSNGDQLQAVIDDLMGEPVLLVDTKAAEEQLETIPWIERAFVTTDFPNRVLIDVRERRPLATFQGSDGRYRVIDRDGRVLTVIDGRPTDYMLLTGPAPDTEAGGFAGAPFAAAAQMVGALPSEIRALTVTASVDATTGDLGLMLLPPASEASESEGGSGTGNPPPIGDDDLIEVRIGSPTNLDGKLARLLQNIRDGLDNIVRIDVSTDTVTITPG
jgi:cell division septal protein FtsQ